MISAAKDGQPHHTSALRFHYVVILLLLIRLQIAIYYAKLIKGGRTTA